MLKVDEMRNEILGRGTHQEVIKGGVSNIVPKEVADNMLKDMEVSGKPINPKDISDVVKDMVSKNKSFSIETGSQTISMNGVLRVITNTKNKLSWDYDATEGDTNMTITKTREGHLKYKQKDVKTGKVVEKRFLRKKATKWFLWDREFSLNGLFIYLEKRKQKMEMFPDYVCFPDLQNVKKDYHNRHNVWCF